MITFALWVESGLWHFLLVVLFLWFALLSMGSHAWRAIRWLRYDARGAANRRQWARSTRWPRPYLKPAVEAVSTVIAQQPAQGAVGLLDGPGPLPRRVPGVAMGQAEGPAERRPSLLADEEDVVTWAIRLTRQAAAEAERSAR